MQDKPSKQMTPQTWDEAIAAGLITRAMVEVLEAPDSLTERIADIARSLGGKQLRSSDQ